MNDREIVPAGQARVHAVAPVELLGRRIVAYSAVNDWLRLVVARGQLDARSGGQAGVTDVAELGERAGMEARVLHFRRVAVQLAGPLAGDLGCVGRADPGLGGIPEGVAVARIPALRHGIPAVHQRVTLEAHA